MHAAETSGFDRLARPYRWLEYVCFGHALERCRCLQLPRMGQTRRTLVLGDGDGRFTASLLSQQPAVYVVAVDSSGSMQSLLRNRAQAAGASSRLTLLQAEAVRLLEAPRQDVAQTLANAGAARAQQSDAVLHKKTGPEYERMRQLLDEGGPFDHVCTHFFLDCLSTSDVQRLVSGVCPRLAPGAIWIVSEFDTPNWWTRLVVAILYRGFSVFAGLQARRLPAWQGALEERDFVRVAEVRLLGGLLTSSCWQWRPRDLEKPVSG